MASAGMHGGEGGEDGKRTGRIISGELDGAGLACGWDVCVGGGMSVGGDDDKGGHGHRTHGLVRSAGVGVLVLGRDGDRLPELYDMMISAELDWIEGEQKAEADLCLALDVPVRERGRVEGDLAEGLCLGEGGEGAGHGREGDDARRRRLGCVLARHPRR